jgi:putative DNA methylase
MVCVDNLVGGILSLNGISRVATCEVLAAQKSPLPSESSHVWFTDPPYYDAIPYSDLSDMFFVWYKRALRNEQIMRDPFNNSNPLTPKDAEAIQDEIKEVGGRYKDKTFFEDTMAESFAEGRRILQPGGVGCIVFAHKTTEGWEALISGIIKGGWIITGSWPIATEQAHRLRARDSAALATSVHLVCRARIENEIGDWGEVLHELPQRVGNWMARLQSEGVRGADLVFACIGPALEIFSQYSRVETAEGREVKLAEFLEKVWEVVGRIALEQILGTGEARTRNGLAGALEEDARLTALFLWTLQSTNGEEKLKKEKGKNEEIEEESENEDDDEEKPKKKKPGFSLIFDVVRRFAQPLGIHLPEWEGRIIETEKGIVRLLSIQERSKALFGEDGAQAVADRLESKRGISPQMMLFPQAKKDAALPIKGRKKKQDTDVSDEALRAQRGATTLDRVHAAMLLQANGRANALRALLKDEQERGPDFLRLANALSALYPKESEEKRFLDAMLLAVPR